MTLYKQLLNNSILSQFAEVIIDGEQLTDSKLLDEMEEAIANYEIIGYNKAYNWLMDNGIVKFNEALSLEITDIEGIASYYLHQQAFEELDKYR